MLKLLVTIRMMTSSFHVFFVRFERLSLVLEDASDRCCGNLKAGLSYGPGNMGKRMRRPFDDRSLLPLRICLQFNGIEKACLLVFCLFSAATNFSYSLKERFFFQFPHAPPHGLGIPPCFLMDPGHPAPSVLSGKTAGIPSSLPLIEMAHGLPLELSWSVHTPPIA